MLNFQNEKNNLDCKVKEKNKIDDGIQIYKCWRKQPFYRN